MTDADPTQPDVATMVDDLLSDLGFSDDLEPEFTLSSGVKLRAVSAPPHLIADIELRYPEPPVPMVDITDDDGKVTRQEPNPTDPVYQVDHRKWTETIERMRQRALFATALEIVEVPDGLCGPDDEEWIDLLRVAGVTEIADEIPAAGTAGRRLMWLLYYALRDVSDLNLAWRRALRMVGVPEMDVANMARLFRHLPGGGADQRRPTEAARQD